MAKRGKSARNKGAAAEREFFALLNKFLPERLRLQRDLAQSRDGGSDSASVVPGGPTSVSIEVKRQEQLRLPQWLAQARNSASVGSYPVVAYRQNHQQWRCLVEMTPVQLAAFMRYSQNIGDTVASIERGIADISG